MAADVKNVEILTSVSVDRPGCSRAVPVSDRESTTLLLARRGRRGIVSVLRLASIAPRSWDPEIGRPGVEVDDKLLRGRANGHRAGPLHIVVLVREREPVALAERRLKRGSWRDVRACTQGVQTLVVLEVDQVLAVLAVRQ